MNEITDFDMSWVAHKGKATITAKFDGEILHIDTISPTSAKARATFASAIAGKGCDLKQAESDLLAIASEFTASVNEDNDVADDKPTSQELLANMDASIVEDAEDQLRRGDLIQLIVDDIQTIGITGEEHNVLLLYLVGTSRLLDRPANAIVQGSSASGKSYLIEKVSELFPPEDKIVASAMTPQALHHMPHGALRHKFVVAGERSRLENDDRAEATRALREMLSGGRLSKLMPSKVGGEIVTKMIEQEGPIAFVESTTLTDIFNEDLNRCLLLHPDESSEQTKRIIISETRSSEPDRQTARLRHYAIQRLLRRVSVEVPYRPNLAAMMPHDKVEIRRMFPMLVSIIKASSLLYQKQRRWINDDTIIATPDDYATAYQLLRKPLAEALAGRVSDAIASYFEWLKTADLPERFCVADILNRADSPRTKSQTYDIFKKLHSANLLLTVESNYRGQHYAINDDPIVEDVLPSPQKLFVELEPENRNCT